MMPYTLIKKKEISFEDVKVGRPFKKTSQSARIFLKLGEASLSSEQAINAFDFDEVAYCFFDKDESVYEVDLKIIEL